jgi:hypothetical protein
MTERWCFNVFPSWWNDKDGLIVIDLGIDESEIGRTRTLVLAAIIGQTSRLRKLDREWKKDLERFNVKFFHAKEHWNRKSKAYSGISVQKRKDLLARLVGHIHKYASAGLAVAIDPEEHISLTTPRFRSSWGSPYAFAIQILVILIRLELEKEEKEGRCRKDEPVNVLIEDGHRNTRQAFEILSKGIGEDAGFLRMKSVGIGGKKDNPILQAADLIAYGCCQEMSRGVSKTLSKLVGAKPEKFKLLRADAGTIELIKRDIHADFKRRRELRLKPRPIMESAD